MWKKILVIILVCVTGWKTASYAYKLIPYKKKKDVYTKVLFFPDTELDYRNVFDYGGIVTSNNLTSLGSLAVHLLSAKRSIDICVYIITSHCLVDVILKCHAKGVKVRVFTDDNTGEGRDLVYVQTGMFSKKGIPVRELNSPFLMHHKFAIIDEESVITGSLNWTLKALTGNHESVLITNEENVVKAYINEFEKLWNTSKT
ncbi:mitochondrial cardiolipin hydrolase-like isoform X1 [Centruroides sculpturatus]|uniref:mitochondrial cardiolipin hydrolase-like isoform X1 n=1 Tax=Centruroides sculpturatus TaxID=218467 RepID=UPI000C6DAE3A|nr:mitochondrial cardiolipin hydrolase-like isoform X1 [Centruroides sculpturatus]